MLLEAFIIIFVLQILFFLVAAALQTDKLTDLSYGLTFIIVALWAAWTTTNPWYWLLAFLIVIWGLRLSSYLFIRILEIRKDDRFDGIRESLPRFAMFWFFQAITIFVILLPLLLLPKGANYSFIGIVGLGIWVLGFLTETIADWEKYQFKKRNPKRWVDVGLWSKARHPNYFGEMLCWWGIFIFALPSLAGFSYLAILSPLYITLLLLFGSGVPMLEKQHDKKYGDEKEYREYKKRTRLLFPF